MSQPIKVWNPNTNSYFEEKVLGAAWINLAYSNSISRKVVSNSSFQRLISKMVDSFQNSRISKSSVQKFVSDFGIDMSLFETPQGGFNSFNDFFIRKIKSPESYFKSHESHFFRSPAEARLSCFEFNTQDFQAPLVIKGNSVSLHDLVGGSFLKKLKASELGPKGHAWVFRLCPVDYHRFHFFDSGSANESTRIPGLLHSVNPLSLQTIPDVFVKNERQITQFQTLNFGPILYLEVGALCVGKIIQSYTANQAIKAGDEKGYFEFGASTVILISFSNWVKASPEILKQSQMGFETKVFLGDKLGEK